MTFSGTRNFNARTAPTQFGTVPSPRPIYTARDRPDAPARTYNAARSGFRKHTSRNARMAEADGMNDDDAADAVTDGLEMEEGEVY
jgi:hypothetical protein